MLDRVVGSEQLEGIESYHRDSKIRTPSTERPAPKSNTELIVSHDRATAKSRILIITPAIARAALVIRYSRFVIKIELSE